MIDILYKRYSLYLIKLREYNYLSMTQAFKRQNSGTYGNPFRTLKDQRVPLEIRAHTVLPVRGTEDAPQTLIEVYYDCWISNYQKTIQALFIVGSAKN